MASSMPQCPLPLHNHTIPVTYQKLVQAGQHTARSAGWDASCDCSKFIVLFGQQSKLPELGPSLPPHQLFPLHNFGQAYSSTQKEVAKWLLSEAAERHCPAAWFLACTAQHKPSSCSGYGWRMNRRWRKRMRASSMLRAPPESSAWQNSLPSLQAAASLALRSSFSSLPP